MDNAELHLAKLSHQVALLSMQATAQMLAATEELSPEDRAEVRDSLRVSIDWNLAAQAAFYEGRETWIGTANRPLDLIQDRREEIEYDGENLMFQSDELLDRYTSLMETLDAVHHKQVCSLDERRARIASAAAKLQGAQKRRWRN